MVSPPSPFGLPLPHLSQLHRSAEHSTHSRTTPFCWHYTISFPKFVAIRLIYYPVDCFHIGELPCSYRYLVLDAGVGKSVGKNPYLVSDSSSSLFRQQ
jgi:hypothetical protein